MKPSTLGGKWALKIRKNPWESLQILADPEDDCFKEFTSSGACDRRDTAYFLTVGSAKLGPSSSRASSGSMGAQHVISSTAWRTSDSDVHVTHFKNLVSAYQTESISITSFMQHFRESLTILGASSNYKSVRNVQSDPWSGQNDPLL